MRVTVLVAAALLAAVVSCTNDSPNAPVINGDRVTICHQPSSAPTLVQIAASELPSHWADGDYIAEFIVDKTGRAGDGFHYARITDALAAARALRISRDELQTGSCRITITVAPGIFYGVTDA